MAEETFSLSEVVASPRTGRRLSTRVSCRRGKSCKAGADSAREGMRATKSCGAGTDFARKRTLDRGKLMVHPMVLGCCSVIAFTRDRVEGVRVFPQEMEEVGVLCSRQIVDEVGNVVRQERRSEHIVKQTVEQNIEVRLLILAEIVEVTSLALQRQISGTVFERVLSRCQSF